VVIFWIKHHSLILLKNKKNELNNPFPKSEMALRVAMFPGGGDRCMDFFDQSFIKTETGGEEEEEPLL
jgi:hypothetical protein